MSEQIEKLKDRLERLESWERAGYVCCGEGPTECGGGTVAIGCAGTNTIYFHFALKEDLRKQIARLEAKKGESYG